MVHPKRTRTSSWFLGACVVSSAVHGGAGYLIPATSFFSAADRSERCPRQDDSFRGNRIAAVPRAAAALWRVAPQQARRQEKSITMKQKQARKKTTRVRLRRAGPRTDVEGYSHSAFLKMRDEVALQVATTKQGTRRSRKINFSGGLDSCPCLVLNADYQPLSYLPLSLWGWQDVIKAVFSEKVVVLATYGDRSIRSPSVVVQLPSVIALKEFVNNHRSDPPFTRRNLFLRDSHRCQYCMKYFPPHNLSFDHVVPKKLGGKGAWDNVVTACGRCNNRKSDCHPRDLRSIGMTLAKYPRTPSFSELQSKARRYPPSEIHETWEDYLYFESEIVEDDEENEEEDAESAA
ncbi:unnamed protein product [Pylaiella littoralis]